MQNFSLSKNKFSYFYIFTPTSMEEKAALSKIFLKRKLDEYEKIMVELDALIPNAT